MASIFTYQEEPPRVHSPWSTSGSGTSQWNGHSRTDQTDREGEVTSVTKLEPERQDGPTEYKLHLLLRSRKHQSGDPSSLRTMNPASNSNRQMRLQQLTTQLLWRLQQSSPFHSSSNADLVLPVLPEATPRLGVPERPAKLLPGLEESQGALYEIGVADDGTLIGLVEEELEESLNNLRAMAASLGCVVDILRRVLIAQYDRKPQTREDTANRTIKIWVAEVLVRPETKSPRIHTLEEDKSTKAFPQLHDNSTNPTKVVKSQTEQLRIAVTGATTSGKSSLVGTLTTSTLDNGRGKSRLSLLKHRHEIASGVTSSVAQELIGYRKDTDLAQIVVNYATGDVSSWPDIHNLANRLVFLSDSPGLPRYAKSTFRTLMSWDPTWTLMCVAADSDDVVNTAGNVSNQVRAHDSVQHGTALLETVDLSLAHLEVCLQLEIPLVVVITKMDLATKSGLKTVLSKILSALKVAGRSPALLGSPSNAISNQDDNVDIPSELAYVSGKEHNEVATLIERLEHDRDKRIVPIVLTSAVTGAGIGKVHALLRQLPPIRAVNKNHDRHNQNTCNSIFRVDEIFAIPPSKVYSENRQDHSADHGAVLCGHVTAGSLSVGDQLRLGPFALDYEMSSTDDGHHTPRSASYCTDNGRRPLPRVFSSLLSKSLQNDQPKSPATPVYAGSTFLDVYVVSLRSLRLPVRCMEAGETGTVGVQPITYPSPVPLSRARKGMVLTSISTDSVNGYRSFSAIFPASDFTNTALPTLILGGHAIAYINSLRAAVKVMALALEDDDIQTEPSSPTEVFSFDGDDEQDLHANGGTAHTEREARITFRFVSSIEWMEAGDKVLVIPTVTAAGPVTGPPVSFNGLSGFVGRVCDVYT